MDAEVINDRLEINGVSYFHHILAFSSTHLHLDNQTLDLYQNEQTESQRWTTEPEMIMILIQS